MKCKTIISAFSSLNKLLSGLYVCFSCFIFYLNLIYRTASLKWITQVEKHFFYMLIDDNNSLH